MSVIDSIVSCPADSMYPGLPARTVVRIAGPPRRRTLVGTLMYVTTQVSEHVTSTHYHGHSRSSRTLFGIAGGGPRWWTSRRHRLTVA